MRRTLLGIAVAAAAAAACRSAATGSAGEGRVPSADGAEIAYSVAGSGSPALVFIHGGLADRTFWSRQVAALAARYRVVTLDLAGHGDSGRTRRGWTIAAWAEDVRAVVEHLRLPRVVLIGNSLGGPVALTAARLLPGRAVAVIGVDTLQDVTAERNPAMFRERAAAFRADFPGTCRALVASLFHPGTQAELHAWAEKRMCAASAEMVASMMEGFADYDPAEAFRSAGVPIRAINGDLFPTRVEKNRTVAPDFDAVILAGCGHYPMLEKPEEFNRSLLEILEALPTKPPGAREAAPSS